jgi:hypothetical protein
MGQEGLVMRLTTDLMDMVQFLTETEISYTCSQQKVTDKCV